jgi:UDP-N-acetylglucosamine/UDP-N-acetylgalactosamine diphosphorylase
MDDSLPPPADESTLRERYRAAGQAHVFRFLPRLDEAARRELLACAADIDLDLVARLATGAPEPATGEMAPAEVVRPAELPRERRQEATLAGEDLLRRGAVAAVLVAGGQATRLGFPGPKGTFPIGPVTGRTLFEWFAGRLLALRARHGRPIPLYVMTSEATHDETVAYFAERAHLGLDPDDVRFFRQGMAPALDDRGRLLLETPSRIFRAPNGHGGVFEALAASGALAEMAARDVEDIFYFQVDNVLARIADPLFLGLHRLAGAEMSSKVVAKQDPEEKVGVVARRGGRTGVVEYSELSEEEMRARGADGRLVYGAGNIAIHAIRRDFAESVAAGDDLPYHRARKAVPHVDEEGNEVRPETPNATKFERFVFDALPRAQRTVTLEVERELEFAPVKNAEGDDSPDTARAAMSTVFRGWLEEAGVAMPARDREDVDLDLEIDPSFALDVHDLRRRLPEPPR